MKTLFLYALVLIVSTVNAEDVVSYVELTGLLAAAKDAYFDKQTLLPVEYTNETMNVTLDINLASINSFDELGGYLEISGYFDVWWAAYVSSPQKNPADVTVLMSSASIWKPSLLLVNSVKGTAEIGDTTSKIRCNLMNWDCLWRPWIVLRGGCTPDVRFYPFDSQQCSFKIGAWGHIKDELKLRSGRSEWNLELFEENAEWSIVETSSENYNQHDVSFVEFKIKLKRIPTYYVINLIAPVTLLALVNVCVFILPAESGERVGFSITCFLSFVVLLNIIMGFIPSSSANLAYLCYYTFIMMVFSCGMSLATVFTLWIHFKSETSDSKVPIVLYGIIYMLKCRCFHVKPPKSGKIISVKPVPADSIWDDKYFAPDYVDDDEDDGKFKVSWKDVASIMDIFFLLGFLGAQTFYSVAYLLPIILN